MIINEVLFRLRLLLFNYAISIALAYVAIGVYSTMKRARNVVMGIIKRDLGVAPWVSWSLAQQACAATQTKPRPSAAASAGTMPSFAWILHRVGPARGPLPNTPVPFSQTAAAALARIVPSRPAVEPGPNPAHRHAQGPSATD